MAQDEEEARARSQVTEVEAEGSRGQLGTVAAIGFNDFADPAWLACFRQLGCTVVQAYRNQELPISIQQMKDYIAAGSMPCDSLHGVFGEQYDPSAPDEAARRRAVDTFKAEGELALNLGGKLVVIHCSTIRYEGVSPEERAIRIAQFKKSVAELGVFGQSIGAQYAFENLPSYHAIGSDVGELACILKETNAPNTGLCFDTGHALMVGDPALAIRQTRGQIIYVHLSDNSGLADEHEMPTCGAMDSEAVASELFAMRFQGTLMLEVFYPVDHLKHLIDDGLADRLANIVAIAAGKIGLD